MCSVAFTWRGKKVSTKLIYNMAFEITLVKLLPRVPESSELWNFEDIFKTFKTSWFSMNIMWVKAIWWNMDWVTYPDSELNFIDTMRKPTIFYTMV